MSKKTPHRVFSYIRFSSAQQAEGGSLARQLTLTRSYCERKGLTLDESLSLHDLGVSAFRGHNVRDGALAGFLEACRTGRVPRGSYLVVESLDRLSRNQIRPALQLFLALQDFGITIVTHEPSREYSPDQTDALALIEPLIIFARAHEESLLKSSRRKDGWDQAKARARAGGGPLLSTCPAWLRVNEAGQFEVKKEAAAAVQRIFALALSGLGLLRIVNTLADEGVPPIGNGGRWVKRYVHLILTGPAAMGTYQPQRRVRQESDPDTGKVRKVNRMEPDGPPIPNHYPAVVDADTWRRAQEALAGRADGRGAGRVAAGEANLLVGLCRCALTGQKMHLRQSVKPERDGVRKRYVYLAADASTGGPRKPGADYPALETAILSRLRAVKASDLLGAPAGGRQAEAARLSGRLLDLDVRIEKAKAKARSADDYDGYLDLIEQLRADRKQASERLAEIEREDAGGRLAALGETHSLIDLMARAPTGQAEELRRRFKARLKALVAEILVLIVPKGQARLCAVQIFFRTGARHDYLALIRHGREPAVLDFPTDLAVPDGIDLRRKADALKVEKLLAAVDPADLVE